MSAGRQAIFGFLFVSIVASAVLQFMIYQNLDSCPKIEFPLLAFLFIVISFFPPMLYRMKRLRTWVVMTHIATSLCGTLFSGASLAELHHVDKICGKNADHEFNMQVAVLVLFNLATIAGHFMGPKKEKKTTREIEQIAEESSNLLKRINVTTTL